MKTLALAAAMTVGLLLGPSPAVAQVDKLLQGLGGGTLSDAKIGSGLKRRSGSGPKPP
jgi:hypothetical protein